jgi:hypothetical protein
MSAGPHPYRIAVISSIILILELTFIREVPAEVKSISYFTNLILMASFFGLGVGCMLQNKPSLEVLFPLGILLTFLFIYLTRGLVVFEAASSVHYWLEPPKEKGLALQIPLFSSALLALIATATPFIALGQALAGEMDRHPRLSAYSWDIGGSLFGTLLFAAASFAQVPPWVWPLVLTLLWSLVFFRGLLKFAIYTLCGVLFFFLANSPNPSRWSPYYLIQFAKQEIGLRVWVNSSFHQLMLNMYRPSKKTQDILDDLIPRFSLPYQIYRDNHQNKSPEKVLILGAGTGNDVNVARINGAKSITAVEIDPVIAEFGRAFNTLQPYSRPEVKLIVDDARHFLESTDQTFDLIIFGTLDSQTLLSGIANLRLENYVYTVEALESAKRLLADGGMVGLYYSVFKPWLYARIYTTVHTAFPGSTIMYVANGSTFLFNTAIVAGKNLPGLKDLPEQVAEYQKGLPSQDDWPFLYLEKPAIAPIYQQLFGTFLVLIAIAFFILRKAHSESSWHFNFLFLGLGFTLMESAAIVRLALLFGSTWIVNAVVFSSVLLTIFIANLLVLKNHAPSLRLAWKILLCGLIVNYLLPLHYLLAFNFIERVLICAALIGIPVFSAAICFSRLFEKEKHTGYALGVNLIGAMSGGFIEYFSMLFGLRAIWLIVIGVYFLAWFSSRRSAIVPAA